MHLCSFQYVQVSEMETVLRLSLPLQSTGLNIWVIPKSKTEMLKYKNYSN